MLKKLVFTIMFFAFIIAGAVVSFANEDDVIVYNRYTVNYMTNIAEETGEEIEEYSHEAVLEKYSSLFFGDESSTETEYIKDININKNPTTTDKQDHSFSATLADNVSLEDGNILVLMFFVKEGDTFKQLISPVEIECRLRFIEPIGMTLPNTGKDNPNCIRIIVFPKDNYNELSLENIQIYDIEILVSSYIFRKDSLKNSKELTDFVWNKVEAK